MKVSTQRFKIKRLVLVTGLVFGMAACSNDDLAPPPPPPFVNTAPVVASTPVTVANEGQLYSYTFSATDLDADPLSYSASASSWLSVDATTGVLSGTPTTDDVGDNAITLTVSDGTDTASQEFVITVIAALSENVAPEFTSTAILTGAAEELYSYTITADDGNFDDLTFSLVTSPDWLTLDQSTDDIILSGTPAVRGDYDVDIMVTDGSLMANQMFTVAVSGPAIVTDVLVLFENDELAQWPAWIDTGGTIEFVNVTDVAGADVPDVDRGQAVKFSLDNAGGSVSGFNSRIATDGVPFDASGIIADGVIKFDLFLISQTTNPASLWEFKLEAGSQQSFASTNLPTLPVVGEWTSYEFPLSSLTSGSSLTTSAIELFMVFPEYGNSAGAEYLVDNFKIVTVEGGGDNGGGDVGNGAVSDFEGAIESYVFNDFAGGVGSVVANPDMSGINTSAQVGQMIKFAGEVYGGSTFTLDGPVDITENAMITMKVWSSRAVPVLFKLEGGPVGEITATHSGSGWEELTFDFTGISGAGNTGVTLIFDNGTQGGAATNAADWTFYFDDVIFPVAPIDVGDGTATDFEGAIESYVFGDFGGGTVSVVANPDMSGINTSAQVGQMIKFAGEVYGGSTFTLAGPVDIPENAMITMKVWSQRAVDVLFKLEGGPVGEITVTHSGSGWEELTFDFTGISGTGNTGVTLIFDNGTAGDAENNAADWTFYFDDIMFPTEPGDGGATDEPTVEAFEGAIDSYTFSDFAGGVGSIVANPDMSGINTSAQVGKMEKFAGEVYGGSTLTLESPVDIPVNAIITMKVWSQRAVEVLLKLEGGPLGERTAFHTGSGWELLSFDFTGVSGAGVTGVTLIFDNGTQGDADNNAADWTFYFDEITIAVADDNGGGGVVDAPTIVNDLEGAIDSYVFGDFGGGVANVIANPDMSGINTSAQVGQMIKFAGEIYGGSTLTLDSAIDIPENAMMSLKVWSQRSVAVLFKLEGGPLGERDAVHGGTGWEVLNFDFTGVVGTGNTGVTLIFDNGTQGDAAVNAADWTFYFDDFTFPAPAVDESQLTTNGDFEAGDLSGWSVAVNGGTISIDNTQASGSTYTAKVVAGMANNPALSQANIGMGTVNPGDMIDISFDMCGSLGGVSGVIFPALLSEFGIDAGSDRQLLEAITSPPSVWTRYNYSVAAGNNVTGGVSLQFDVVCGAVEGCVAEANFDNVSVTIGGGIAPGEASGNSCIAGDNSGGGGSTGETNVTDFEGAIESYAFGDFAGGAASVIANPDMSGINTSAQVGQMVKFAGEIYGGSTFTLASPVDIPVNAVITMKVWSPRAVAVLFKLEGGPLGEITATHSGSGWEELTFDFTGISGTGNTGVTLIFDNGTAGDAENNAADWTFYFDDMTIPAAASDGGGDDQLTELGFDFEDGVTGTWTVFENDSDPELAFITNPDTSGANTSATVAQFTATQMGQRYAGTETKSAPTFSLDASNSTVRIMVWKSVISQVGIKFARADGGAEFETLVSNTVTNAWEELTFDFSGQVGVGVTTDLTTIIVFPDYYADGSNRAQENIVYFDNITFSAN